MSKESNRLVLQDLLSSLTTQVEVAPGKNISVRALVLSEMVEFFVDNQIVFLTIYAECLKPGSIESKLGKVLLAAPEMVTQIIAKAMDADFEDEKTIKMLPATVQLIALREIFRLSVPDPKKASLLLSEVMGELRRLSKNNSATESQPQSSLQETLPAASNSLSPTDTASPTSGVTA